MCLSVFVAVFTFLSFQIMFLFFHCFLLLFSSNFCCRPHDCKGSLSSPTVASARRKFSSITFYCFQLSTIVEKQYSIPIFLSKTSNNFSSSFLITWVPNQTKSLKIKKSVQQPILTFLFIWVSSLSLWTNCFWVSSVAGMLRSVCARSLDRCDTKTSTGRSQLWWSTNDPPKAPRSPTNPPSRAPRSPSDPLQGPPVTQPGPHPPPSMYLFIIQPRGQLGVHLVRQKMYK